MTASPPKAILITGAAQGLGQAMALHLAAPNTLLLLHYRHSLEAIRHTAQQAQAKGARTVLLQAELDDMAQREQLMDQVAQATPSLSVLVNNVGVYHNLPLLDITPAQWQHTLDATLSSTFHLIQRARPLLLAAGSARIINLGDAASDRITARTEATHYHMAKLGIHLLTRSFAKALAPAITVNLISPGILDNSVDGLNLPIPAGRTGHFSDVLSALDYLLSPQAQYVTGTNLLVAGGWNL